MARVPWSLVCLCCACTQLLHETPPPATTKCAANRCRAGERPGSARPGVQGVPFPLALSILSFWTKAPGTDVSWRTSFGCGVVSCGTFVSIKLRAQFMNLANHAAALNSSRGAAFGFASIAKLAGEQLAPYVPPLVPKLYR